MEGASSSPCFAFFKSILLCLCSFFFVRNVSLLYRETNIENFLTSNFALSPLFGTLIGLIPNCASSILLSSLYIEGALPFGALLSGLLVNAGLGMLFLFKNKKKIKEASLILSICVTVSLVFGYIFLYVF